ncbi:hypothetical protein IEQ34_008057 [Dendrobium chrysotoxum]|uniref:CCT domain-containing protein n=1 Tax=Dendrobium chrysotoxum TaxID=161865 RepID=A0AAV7H7I7_DENCH|nr:hypothetical protein IEQ34_008057 [Dendrobium chrysotoxum]
MLEDLIESPEHLSLDVILYGRILIRCLYRLIQAISISSRRRFTTIPSLLECLSSSLADQILNFDNEDKLFEEAGYSPIVLSPTNNVVCSSDVPATVTFPATDTTTDLPCYDENSDLLSVLLNPLPPPEPEPDILQSFPAVSMAPVHPMDHLNPMISNPSFTSYPPNSVVSQLPVDPLGLPGYMGMEPSAMQHCPFLDANGGIGGEIYADGMGMPTFVADDEMGMYGSVGMPVRPLEAAEACGLGGIYTYGAMPRVYSPRNLQVLGDNQHTRPRCSTSTAPLQVPFDIPTMDDSNNKVGRASAEERKEKLDRYVRKRKVRNFTKKIKYACRKTLADSRPRVRGRFAKNEEFSEVVPTPCSANGGYDDEEMSSRNDEDILPDSSDILAHISGVNSFGFHYPVESWI